MVVKLLPKEPHPSPVTPPNKEYAAWVEASRAAQCHSYAVAFKNLAEAQGITIQGSTFSTYMN